MEKYAFTLEKQAKSGGGDKYQCDSIADFNIYFPQAISRTGGKIKAKIVIQVVANNNDS